MTTWHSFPEARCGLLFAVPKGCRRLGGRTRGRYREAVFGGHSCWASCVGGGCSHSSTAVQHVDQVGCGSCRLAH